jgi:hypothetical protein
MRLTSMQFDGGDEGNYTPPKPLAPTPLAAKESGSIGATSMASQMAAASTPAKPKNSEYRGNAGGTAAKAKTPVDKSGYDRSIKVPQATVDAVKADGAKAAANKVAYGSPGYVGSTMSPNAPVSKEYKEATKRVYPNAKATSPAASSGATNPKQSGPDAARAAATAPKAAAPKMYGGAAAEKYKSEKNKAALPPILPGAQNMPFKPGTGGKAENMPFKPGTGGKIENMPFKPLLPSVTPKATPKASAPAKTKVSQATVNAVKSQGKAKAISNAKSNVTNAEYKEAVKRVYQSPAKAKPKAKSGGGGGKASSAVK